jgi:hypothetical protein
MNIPPAILDLKIAPVDGRRIHLWLPIFLLWPILLALLVLSLVFTIIADFVLIVLGQRYHRYTFLLLGSLAALCETRGMVVRIHAKDAAVDVTVN